MLLQQSLIHLAFHRLFLFLGLLLWGVGLIRVCIGIYLDFTLCLGLGLGLESLGLGFRV